MAGRVVGVAVEAGGRHHLDARAPGDLGQPAGVAAEPDGRQVHDRADAARPDPGDLLGDAVEVAVLLARQRRRGEEQVLVRVDPSEPVGGERPEHALHGRRHGASR